MVLIGYRYMKYHIDSVDPSKGPTYERAKKFGQILLDNCTLGSNQLVWRG